MAGWLSTHVLDTALGVPAAGLEIALWRLEGDAHAHVVTMVTNDDGRTDAPILAAADFATGEYELVFQAGEYLRRTAGAQAEPLFLDVVPIRFGMNDPEAHYHVPLLLSPFGYSTYRGS
ncbi:MAG: hydroxyisourate hydrolase [Amylibacter sp.]|jgi:5-hydroxyisourate hydrolase|nr:hydroxyisourate hydrolase [Amylibacter sp.]